jgi:hypothetical protein
MGIWICEWSGSCTNENANCDHLSIHERHNDGNCDLAYCVISDCDVECVNPLKEMENADVS